MDGTVRASWASWASRPIHTHTNHPSVHPPLTFPVSPSPPPLHPSVADPTVQSPSLAARTLLCTLTPSSIPILPASLSLDQTTFFRPSSSPTLVSFPLSTPFSTPSLPPPGSLSSHRGRHGSALPACSGSFAAAYHDVVPQPGPASWCSGALRSRRSTIRMDFTNRIWSSWLWDQPHLPHGSRF